MLLVLTIFYLLSACECHQYSERMNPRDYEKLITLDKPFRMQKLNLVWEKALKKIAPEKLKQLYSDLKYQDKEELAWKKLKADGLDKNGLKEALIRGSFNAILEKYHLAEDFKAILDAALLSNFNENEYSRNAHIKTVFRDKKLNKLWLKAEQQGFTEEQLQTLKEEFQHHQNKIDQYYQLMDQVNKGSWFNDEPSNAVEHLLEAEEGEKFWKASPHPHQLLKEKHAELKVGYIYLANDLIPSLRNMEFEEPQVNTLWEMAKNASFSPAELENLRGELHHFEHRIQKLKTLTSLELENDSNFVDASSIKRVKKIKEYNYKVDKIHRELAGRILQKHTEL